MKLKILLILLVLLLSTSCSLLYYETSNPYSESNYFKEYNAERKAQIENQLKYTQSAEFQKKYNSGKSLGNSTDGAKAPSVVGTTADPYHVIRNVTMGTTTTLPTIDIRVIKY